MPSGLAVTEVTRVVPAYKLTVTGLPASTCPVREPLGRAVGVGDATGVEEVGVAVSTGVEEVGVAVSTGVDEVGVAVSTGVEEVGVAVSTGVDEVGVAVSTGVEEVGVAVSTGVEEVGVAVSAGVGVDVNVGVGVPSIIVRVAAPVEGKGVRLPSPIETRAVHSIEVSATCPKGRCKAVTLKVKAGPLVVALLPLLPAMAKIKLPFCGLLNAVTGSAPNKPPATTLLAATKFAS